MQGTERKEVEFQWSGLTLAGTLHLPRSVGPHPAVLMMQGSGPADRDNDEYFTPIRETFLERDIAVFSFDKPGVGESTGDWRDYALEGRAQQARAALDHLSSLADIDGERVGIWGHSQGGWLAQILASRLPELAFAIANSGPAIGLEAQDLFGCEHSMRAGGHSETEIEEALRFLRSLHSQALMETDYAEVEELLLRPARGESWYGYLTVDDEADWAFVCTALKERYDPSEALTRISCPYLATYGGRDLLVPAWESAKTTEDALDRAPTTDAMVVVFPAGDHRIQDPGTGRLPTGYLDLIGGWAARRVADVDRLPP
ncbi:MAG: alpha/beta hydrolase family protein [Acidimicrobiia bacterium]